MSSSWIVLIVHPDKYKRFLRKIILLFRPERCSKKYERVFLEWDAMEHAFLQPCGFFDPDIYQGGPPRKGKIP